MSTPPIQGGTTHRVPMQDDFSRTDAPSGKVQNQSGDADLEDFVDLYGPASPKVSSGQEVSPDEFELIETEDSFDMLISQDARESTPAGTKTTFLPDDARLNDELGLRAERDLNANPKDFLQFVARNTNPQRTWFSFKNLLNILTDLISLKKPTLVLNQNSVHCARAVDQTLAQFTPQGRGPDTPRLHQVAEGRRGAFEALINQHPGLALEDQGAFIRELTEAIGEGSRGCISMPVKGRPFSHAMNVVNMTGGNGLYIVCGQQNRVYDLNDPGDLEHFWSRYEIRQNQAAVIARTGQAPETAAPSSGQSDGQMLNLA